MSFVHAQPRVAPRQAPPDRRPLGVQPAAAGGIEGQDGGHLPRSRPLFCKMSFTMALRLLRIFRAASSRAGWCSSSRFSAAPAMLNSFLQAGAS